MNLSPDIYPRLEKARWFLAIGREPAPQFDFPVTYVSCRETALSMFNSDLWADARTEAQGDLTGYLSKHHHCAYGGHWNKLARQSRVLIEKAVGNRLSASLASAGLPSAMVQPILVDLNRVALEFAYWNKFPKVPLFFHALLLIYEAGRLPCGWNGQMDDWPIGNVIAY